MTGYWDFACPDWWQRMQAGRAPFSDLPIDARLADEAVGIFDYFRLPDVVGQPTLEDATGDWMRAVVRAVFGALDRRSGQRAIDEALVLVPKKNGKTTNAAALALTYMLLNGRGYSDSLIVGPTQKIAETAFRQARGMIRADPEGYLQQRFLVKDHEKTIVDTVTESRLMIRTFGADVLTGCKPVFCLIDELHELAHVANAELIVDQITSGMAPFPESLLVYITTQGPTRPAGVFREKLMYARGVRDGRIRDRVRFLPVLYEFPEEIQRADDQPWRDPALWAAVNPNAGRSITVAALEDLFAKAHEAGPERVISWATQHLNVEVGLALHADRWPGADHWEGAAEDGLDLGEVLARSDLCTVGIDMGGSDDLAALAVLGRERGTGRWLAWSRAWVQRAALDMRKGIAPELRGFAADGDLVLVERHSQIEAQMVEIVKRVKSAGLLPAQGAVGMDTYGQTDLVAALRQVPLADTALAGVRQGEYLAGTIHTVEHRLAEARMVHGGRPLMAWCVGNAKVEQGKTAIRITKKTAGRAKIDPLMALFGAAALMARGPEPDRRRIALPADYRVVA